MENKQLKRHLKMEIDAFNLLCQAKSELITPEFQKQFEVHIQTHQKELNIGR